MVEVITHWIVSFTLNLLPLLPGLPHNRYSIKLAEGISVWMRSEAGVTGWELCGADSEAGISGQDVYRGVVLEWACVEEKEGKQDWAEREIELGALKLGRVFRVVLSVRALLGDQAFKPPC